MSTVFFNRVALKFIFSTGFLEACYPKRCPIKKCKKVKNRWSQGGLIECFLSQVIEKHFYGRFEDKLRFENLAYALKQSRKSVLSHFSQLTF